VPREAGAGMGMGIVGMGMGKMGMVLVYSKYHFSSFRGW